MSIPFADYVAGIRAGYYPRANKPSFKSTKNYDIAEDELDKEIGKRAVKKFLDTVPPPILDQAINSRVVELVSPSKFRLFNTPGVLRILLKPILVKLTPNHLMECSVFSKVHVGFVTFVLQLI